MDAFGHDEFFAGLPTCSIQHEEHPLALAHSERLSEMGQRNREHLRRHGGQEQPLRLSGNGMDKTVDIEPLVALVDRHPWASSFAHPDPSQDRFETNAMLIGGPQLHCRFGERLLDGSYLLSKVFLKSSWAAGSALAWRGRSTR